MTKAVGGYGVLMKLRTSETLETEKKAFKQFKGVIRHAAVFLPKIFISHGNQATNYRMHLNDFLATRSCMDRLGFLYLKEFSFFHFVGGDFLGFVKESYGYFGCVSLSVFKTKKPLIVDNTAQWVVEKV